MRLSPPALRGAMYPGLLTKSCFAYNPCSLCTLCTNYDPNAATCTYCEGRKPQGNGHHCQCKESQRQVKQAMEARFNRTLNPQAGQSIRPLNEQIPLDQANEDLYKRIKEEFHVETKVTEQ